MLYKMKQTNVCHLCALRLLYATKRETVLPAARIHRWFCECGECGCGECGSARRAGWLGAAAATAGALASASRPSSAI